MNWKLYYKPLWWLCFFILLAPSVQLCIKYFQHELGINGLQTLQHTTGNWSIYALLLSLLITPLRRVLAHSSMILKLRYGKRLSDWNWIIRMRRMFGLFCFYYAFLHLFVYVYFDLALEWQWLMGDLEEKTYMWFGLAAFCILIPLAITSHKSLMRLMGRHWRTLHRQVYIISILISIHILMSAKVGVNGPWILSFLLWIMLLYRVFAQTNFVFARAKDDGMEVPERN